MKSEAAAWRDRAALLNFLPFRGPLTALRASCAENLAAAPPLPVLLRSANISPGRAQLFWEEGRAERSRGELLPRGTIPISFGTGFKRGEGACQLCTLASWAGVFHVVDARDFVRASVGRARGVLVHPCG